MKTVIIGGVAGGMSAATRLRRLDESAEIVVLERSGHVSYANCGLPYHLGGVIPERDALLLQTPESLRARFALDVRVRHEVTGIDTAARTLTVRDAVSGSTYTETYDHLVLSPGAAPFVPDVPGVERAHALRTVEDLDALVRALDAAPRTAVVAGGGFVGLETAENLRRRGLDVTVVELADQVLAPLDPELAALVHAELRRNGVAVELGTSLSAVGPREVELASGRRLPADLVVLAIGVRPDIALARAAGLAIGPRGGIAVDARMRTSDPRVFAVGDAAEKADAVGDGPVLVPLANAANRAGRQVADVIAGRDADLAPSLGTAIVAVFGLTVAVTGWNEKRARAAGRPHQAVHTHPASHAGYYPGAAPMALKLVFDPSDGRILGAQGVGTDGVDKRIDVIATAMRGGLRAADLADLELAYAPQFGSAKDPVNMLGYIAGNVASGDGPSVQWHELDEAVAAGAVLVDVRTPGEFAAGHIPGAVNVPLDELRDRAAGLPDAPLIVYCGVGLRAHTASRLLAGLGRRAANLDGGYRTWSAAA
ncbi:FAD-dependent oxidoreductase [Spirillospora albida]|uniref:FAD-dependent oxidoreductase n=1 Tax=Spirillospora albida TaxID=58123 RepID=UPI0004C0F137|nr:FAD-dependent oxidoreductase [Spirillospora albida]